MNAGSEKPEKIVLVSLELVFTGNNRRANFERDVDWELTEFNKNCKLQADLHKGFKQWRKGLL